MIHYTLLSLGAKGEAVTVRKRIEHPKGLCLEFQLATGTLQVKVDKGALSIKGEGQLYVEPAASNVLLIREEI